jgi:DNA-binding FadR family transcriptional regulator
MDVEFHIQLAACSHNSFLYHLTSSIRSSLIGVIKELRIHDYQAPTETLHGYHRSIFEAIRDKNPESAENATSAHFNDAISRLRNVLKERPKE